MPEELDGGIGLAEQELPVTETEETTTSSEEVQESAGENQPSDTVSGEPEQEEPSAEHEAQGSPDKDIPSQLAKWAREFKNENPDRAKFANAVRDGYFRAEQYDKTFGGLEAARNLKTLIESVGGEDGLGELQSAAESLRDIDERVASGDPRVIEAMATETPEGFKKLMPVAMDHLAKIDPEGYENIIRRPLLQVLSNIAERLEESAAWIDQQQPEFAKRQLGAVLGWIAQQSKQGTSPYAPQQAAPNADLDARESRIREAEERSFVSDVANQTIPHIKSLVFGELAKDIANARLGEEAKNALFRDVMGQIDRLDSKEMARWRALVRNGDVSRAASYVKARAESMAARVARDVWKTRYGAGVPPQRQSVGTGKPAAKAATPSNKSGTASSPLRVSSKPPDSEIDRTIPNWQTLLITGMARLKSSGKYVRWTPAGR